MHETIEQSPRMLNVHIPYGHNGNNYRPPNMAWHPEPHDVAVIAKMKRTISSLRIVPPSFSYGNSLLTIGISAAAQSKLSDSVIYSHLQSICSVS